VLAANTSADVHLCWLPLLSLISGGGSSCDIHVQSHLLFAAHLSCVLQRLGVLLQASLHAITAQTTAAGNRGGPHSCWPHICCFMSLRAALLVAGTRHLKTCPCGGTMTASTLIQPVLPCCASRACPRMSLLHSAGCYKRRLTKSLICDILKRCFARQLHCALTSAALLLLYSTWLLGSSSIASEKNLIASS
jgi:hypothetical protein